MMTNVRRFPSGVQKGNVDYIGTQVTAWHHAQGEILKLDRLEYPLEVSHVPAGEFVPRIKKIILLSSSNAGDAEPIYSSIEQLFRENFDWVVAHRGLAEEIRRRALKDSGVTTYPTAHRNRTAPEPLVPADPELIQRISSGTRVDAVLEIRIEYVRVAVKSHMAKWDGTSEKFGSNSARFASAITMRPIRGEVPAATAVLKLYDPEGRLLWSNRRGFRVLAFQVGLDKDLRDRSLAEGADDAAFLDAWLADVFTSWIEVRPAPSGTTAHR